MLIKHDPPGPVSAINNPPAQKTKRRSLTDLPPEARQRIRELVCPDLAASARESPRVLEVEIVRCPCEHHVLEGPCVSAGVFLCDQYRPISKLLSIDRETHAMVRSVFPDVLPIGHERYEVEKHCRRGMVRFNSRRDIVLVHKNSEVQSDPSLSFTANRHVRRFSWSGIRNLALSLRGGSPKTVSSTLPGWSRRVLFKIQQGMPGLEKLYLAWDMGLPGWSRCNFQGHYALSRPSSSTPWSPTDTGLVQYWWSPLGRILNHAGLHQGNPLTARQLEDFQTDRMLEGWSNTEKGKLRQTRFKMNVMHVRGYTSQCIYLRPVQHSCKCDLVPDPSCLRCGTELPEKDLEEGGLVKKTEH